MKKYLLHFIVAALYCSSAIGQTCSEPFLGSKTLYKAESHQTDAPPGFLPVFINHVGRHGARHLTNEINSSAIYKLLLKADSSEDLTADGDRLKKKIVLLDSIEKKYIKSISDAGKKEQAGLARRMYENYRNVFVQPASVVSVDYTKEIRTLQSSEAFLGSLRTGVKNLQVKQQQANDTTLRFYDLSPAYRAFKKNGSWIKSLGELKKQLNYQELTDNISKKFFKPARLNKLTEEDREDFVSGMYGLITIVFSIQKEIADAGYSAADLDIQSFLGCKELLVLAEIDNAEDFLQKGPATGLDAIRVTIAAPLLADFIQSTDNFIRTGSVQANLRFSHAETIAPFAALLSFKTASEPVQNVEAISRVWQAANVIPLSANIQWILYQKTGSKDDFLIKFLLNEKEAKLIGLPAQTFPYYKWSEVREFYLHKLETLQLLPGQNYFDYLQQLK